MRKLIPFLFLALFLFSPKAFAQTADYDVPIEVKDHQGVVRNYGLILGYELSPDNWLSLYWDLNKEGLENKGVVSDIKLEHALIWLNLSPEISIIRLEQNEYQLSQPKDFLGHTFPYGYSIRLRPGEYYEPQVSQHVSFTDQQNNTSKFISLDQNFGTCFVQSFSGSDITPSYDLKIYGLKTFGEPYKLPGVFIGWEGAQFDRKNGQISMNIMSTGANFQQPLDIQFNLRGDNYRLLKSVTSIYSPDELKTGLEAKINFEMVIPDDEYIIVEALIDPLQKIIDRHDFFQKSWNNAYYGTNVKAEGLPFLSDDQFRYYTNNEWEHLDCRIDQNGIGIGYDATTQKSLVPESTIYRFFTPEVIQLFKLWKEKEAELENMQGYRGMKWRSGSSQPADSDQINFTGYYPSVMGFQSAMKSVEERKKSVQTFLRWQAIYEGNSDQSFLDVATEDWYASLVQKAKEAGIVQGKADTAGNLLYHFSPNDAVSKAELLKMAYLASGLSPASSSGGAFSDHWASDFWNDARQRTLTLVRSGTPDDIIKRKDAVQFMVELLGIPLEQDFSALEPYNDVSKDSELAKYVYTAAMRGAITKRAQFQPEVTLNRAEQLAFIYQFLKAIGR